MARLLNDGSKDAPRLRVYLNLDNLTDLRSDTAWPGLTGPARYERLKADGFEGVQFTTRALHEPCAPLPYCGLDRINTAAEADGIVAKHAALGDSCMTVHAGWGLEDNNEVFRLVEAILAAQEKHRLPVFIETHRATITQDIWRTVQIIRHFPEIRLNADFSHYYCGQELVYGDWETKLAFLEPIFERVGFIHGRMASSGCMQVPVGLAHGATDYVEHFRELWVRAMGGFLRGAGPGDVLIFAPELLAGTHYYARLFPGREGELREESDRYAQALIYRELALECFADALSQRLKLVPH